MRVRTAPGPPDLLSEASGACEVIRMLAHSSEDTMSRDGPVRVPGTVLSHIGPQAPELGTRQSGMPGYRVPPPVNGATQTTLRTRAAARTGRYNRVSDPARPGHGSVRLAALAAAQRHGELDGLGLRLSRSRVRLMSAGETIPVRWLLVNTSARP